MIRDGKVIAQGVGIGLYVKLWDQVVRFPSKINRVSFEAEQITLERQGLQVRGVIMWTIFREGDGPARAYKYLGDDLTSGEPETANANLKQMSASIVRDKIANSMMRDVL